VRHIHRFAIFAFDQILPANTAMPKAGEKSWAARGKSASMREYRGALGLL
jgi:hypothetical protein